MTYMTEPAKPAAATQEAASAEPAAAVQAGEQPAEDVATSEQEQKLRELAAIKALVSKDNPTVRRLYEDVDDDASALQQYGRRAAQT